MMITKHLAVLLIGLFSLPVLGFARASQNDRGRSAASITGDVESQENSVNAIISEAEKNYREGESAYQAGSFADARIKFDRAIDIILSSGLSLKTHPDLSSYFKRLVEKINAVAEQAMASGQGVRQQSYDAPPLEQLANIELNKEELAGANDESIGTELDFKYTPTTEVGQYVHFFTNGKGRSTMETGLRRAGRYLNITRRIFREEGVPLDLVWLAQAESNWRPEARSWANAQGIWQFVPYTGRKYGLQQTAWLDERSGIEQPARAAARYLKWLYERYLDWQLAMAAYNCGEGAVDRAIAVSGYSDFWYLHRNSLLPRETRNYVPIILAIIIIAKDPQRHGFTGITPEPALAYDQVKTRGAIDLRLVSEIVNAPLERIQELNPELRRGTTPPEMEFGLRLPLESGSVFEDVINKIPVSRRGFWRVHNVAAGESLDSIAQTHDLDPKELADTNELAPEMALRPGDRLVIPTTIARTPLKSSMVSWSGPQVQLTSRHSRSLRITARPGDTLTRIAARYGLSAKELARINRLNTSSRLRPGQPVLLNLPPRQKRDSGRKRVTTSRSQASAAGTVRGGKKRIHHTVKSGESLTRIANRYRVSVSDLKRWNRLSSNQVRSGQQITVRSSR